LLVQIQFLALSHPLVVAKVGEPQVLLLEEMAVLAVEEVYNLLVLVVLGILQL
jgi:hypothetical protein